MTKSDFVDSISDKFESRRPRLTPSKRFSTGLPTR